MGKRACCVFLSSDPQLPYKNQGVVECICKPSAVGSEDRRIVEACWPSAYLQGYTKNKVPLEINIELTLTQ